MILYVWRKAIYAGLGADLKPMWNHNDVITVSKIRPHGTMLPARDNALESVAIYSFGDSYWKAARLPIPRDWEVLAVKVTKGSSRTKKTIYINYDSYWDNVNVSTDSKGRYIIASLCESGWRAAGLARPKDKKFIPHTIEVVPA